MAGHLQDQKADTKKYKGSARMEPLATSPFSLHDLPISSELLADLMSKLPADYRLPDQNVIKEEK